MLRLKKSCCATFVVIGCPIGHSFRQWFSTQVLPQPKDFNPSRFVWSYNTPACFPNVLVFHPSLGWTHLDEQLALSILKEHAIFSTSSFKNAWLGVSNHKPVGDRLVCFPGWKGGLLGTQRATSSSPSPLPSQQWKNPTSTLICQKNRILPCLAYSKASKDCIHKQPHFLVPAIGPLHGCSKSNPKLQGKQWKRLWRMQVKEVSHVLGVISGSLSNLKKA